jgi:exodeoxyribonuclease VII large subunit
MPILGPGIPALYHGAMTPFDTTPPKDQHVLSVAQLNRLARSLLEDNFPAVLVEGEISNFASPASGHWYFTLKDDQAQVRCAMFRNRSLMVKFRPRDGVKILVKAKLSLYEGRGDYQLIVERMEESGAGALQRAFEELKQKLQREGLFNPADKKPLPALPRHIAVITSPTGAAVRDIISVHGRRFPAIDITVVPVAVQGREAPAELSRALALVNRREGCLQDVDVILIGRGGGSLEDLWAFNDEQLARAIHASALPVISAVGHETDFTIADFVADIRAPTPSAAAELLSPDRSAIMQQFNAKARQLVHLLQGRLVVENQYLRQLRLRLRHPGERLMQQMQRLDDLEARARRAMLKRLSDHKQGLRVLEQGMRAFSPAKVMHRESQRLLHLRQRLQAAAKIVLASRKQHLHEQVRALHTVSPLATLARGYSLTTSKDGTVIRRYSQLAPGDTITTRLAQGSITSKVTGNSAD